MKDVGILTFHDTCNFGAILQAYALYKVVSSLGYKTEIIDYQNENIRKREIPIVRYKKDRRIKEIIKWILRGKKEQQKYERLSYFLNNNTKISKTQFNVINFYELAENYNGILVGSDMLWCTRYTLSDYSYMLDGISGIKKMSYATSVGYRWGELEERRIMDLLSDFNDIAVRENDIANYLSYRLTRKVKCVCDPTMLIDQKEWSNLIIDKNKKDRILIYMDDEKHNCKKAAKKIAQIKNGVDDIQTIGFQIFPWCKNKIVEAYRIEDFLTALYNSSIIITASYHGLLFAIYFHVPFIFFSKDSSRVATLVERLGIGYRDGNKYNVTMMKDINWDVIDENVTTFRTESMKILSDMLEGV